MPDSDDQRAKAAAEVAHALAYPFSPPRFSFHHATALESQRRLKLTQFCSDISVQGVTPLCNLTVVTEEGGSVEFENRVPVIAAGSNASPARLRTKFLAAGVEADFPVIRARVQGLVPVYSAHISKYGSIPGTLTGEPGAYSLLQLAFLTKAELDVLNDSESIGKNYALALIGGLDISLAKGGLDRVLAYMSKRGAFAPQGVPLRISAFHTRGSTLNAAGQRRILHHARRIVESAETLDRFIRRNIEDEEERLRRTAALAARAMPCTIAGLRVIAGGMKGPAGSLPAW